MNCKKAEELIVLYSELSLTEQSKVEEHLETCFSCTAFFTSIQQQQDAFFKTQNWNAEIIDPVAFTDHIMEALPKRSVNPTKQKNEVYSLFSWTPLQTSLTVCSLVLAFTFAVETNRTEKIIQDQQLVKNGVALTTNPEKLIQAKRSRIERFSLEKLINQDNTFALSNQ